MSYSQFLSEVDGGRISNVTISGQEISGLLSDGRLFQTYAPNDPGLVQKLTEKGVNFSAKPLTDGMPWYLALLINWLPLIIVMAAWFFLSRQMQ
ncbi:MAG: ATP-dependent metallopeptidase FtsH/Yme1/Tma family protein, partial [Dolichospermum sp.]